MNGIHIWHSFVFAGNNCKYMEKDIGLVICSKITSGIKVLQMQYAILIIYRVRDLDSATVLRSKGIWISSGTSRISESFLGVGGRESKHVLVQSLAALEYE